MSGGLRQEWREVSINKTTCFVGIAITPILPRVIRNWDKLWTDNEMMFKKHKMAANKIV